MHGAKAFNATKFSRWINGSGGRAFRLAAGTAFVVLAWASHGQWWGIAAGLWSFFPLTASIFDVCWISAALGGPLSGRKIRQGQEVLTV
jgi:hypothetical protein